MRDVTSGMASTVIQVYLKVILNSVVHPALEVRRAALRVIGLVLAQGLVNPVQIVPYLICMSTDPRPLSHTPRTGSSKKSDGSTPPSSTPSSSRG
ncbi:Nipped-B protein [Caligus rogercresseyi]|uniref:Nipped-B protein n=1 Tax=Caligus rogercresseyi TaxID=217165 RepID=A0A7T8GSM2_CALRO|nr:Nipped-B protein [Caligus rogercresseyi]